jgi:hypothetical protein
MKTYVPHMFLSEKETTEEDDLREHQRDVRCLKRLDDWWEGQKGAVCPK